MRKDSTKAKKAQMAMEYLSTYVYMTIGLVVVVAALFLLGAFDKESYLREGCATGDQLVCMDVSASSTGIFTLRVGNNLPRNARILEFNVSATSAGVEASEDSGLPIILAHSNDTLRLQVAPTLEAGKKEEFTYTIVYNPKGSKNNYTIAGTAVVKVVNILELAGYCGDGYWDGAKGEECDGTQFSRNCFSEGYTSGLPGTVPTCTPDTCMIDYTDCNACMNGMHCPPSPPALDSTICINGGCRDPSECEGTARSGFGCSDDTIPFNDPAAGTCTDQGCSHTDPLSMDCASNGGNTCQRGVDPVYDTCNAHGGFACDTLAGGDFAQDGLCITGGNTCFNTEAVCLSGAQYRPVSHGSCQIGDACDATIIPGNFLRDGTVVVAHQCCSDANNRMAYSSGPLDVSLSSCGTTGTLGGLCDHTLADGVGITGVIAGNIVAGVSSNCCTTGFALGEGPTDSSPWHECSPTTCTNGVTCFSLSPASVAGGLSAAEAGLCIAGDVCETGGVCRNAANTYVSLAACAEGSVCDTDIDQTGYLTNGMVYRDGVNRCCTPGQYFQDAGAGRTCCVNGGIVASGTKNARSLCYNGALYDCGDGLAAVGPEDFIPVALGGSVDAGAWNCLPDGTWSDTQVGVGGVCTNGDRCYLSFCANGICSTTCSGYPGAGCSVNALDYTNTNAGTCTGVLASAQCTLSGTTSMNCDATGTAACQPGIDATSASCIGGDSCDTDAGGAFSQEGVCSTAGACEVASFLCLRATSYYHASVALTNCQSDDPCDDSIGPNSGDFVAGIKRYDPDDNQCESCVNSRGNDGNCELACGADALADERTDGYSYNNKASGTVFVGCPAYSSCLVASSPACQVYDGDGTASVCGGLGGTWTAITSGNSEIDNVDCSAGVACGDGVPGNGFCCGDDANENYKICNAGTGFPDAGSCDASDVACCASSTDCVTANAQACVATGSSVDADGDGDTDYCSGGTWQDCNTNANCASNSFCSSGNCMALNSPTILLHTDTCSAGNVCASGGKGRVYFNWNPVPGATSYTVWIFNGRTYEAHDIGNALSWDSDVAKWWPTNAQIDAWAAGGWVGNIFASGGANLAEDPNYMYYKAADPAYMTTHFYYWIHISANGLGGSSSGVPWGPSGNQATWVGGETMPDCTCFADGQQCHPSVGDQAENERYCNSGFCDNDGVGLADDGWCYTPIDSSLRDNQDNACEYDAGSAPLLADERPMNTPVDNRASGSNYLGCPANSACYITSSPVCGAYDGDYNAGVCGATYASTWISTNAGDRVRDSNDCANGVNCGNGNPADGFCCGDDSAENYRTRIAASDAPSGYATDANDKACCDNADESPIGNYDSVKDGVCYAPGAHGTAPQRAWAYWGQWYGGDYADGGGVCGALGFTWLASASGGANGPCCGDDTTSDDFDQSYVVGGSACIDGVVRPHGWTSGAFMVSDGRLFSCNSGSTYNFDDDYSSSWCSGTAGMYCSASGTWTTTKDLGCGCSSGSECASGTCCGVCTTPGTVVEGSDCCGDSSLCSDSGYARGCYGGTCGRDYQETCTDDSQCGGGYCYGGTCSIRQCPTTMSQYETCENIGSCYGSYASSEASCRNVCDQQSFAVSCCTYDANTGSCYACPTGYPTTTDANSYDYATYCSMGSCSAGSDCYTGVCIGYECSFGCAAQNNEQGCSTDASYMSGICTDGGCEYGTACRSGTTYYSGAYSCTTGSACDSDIDGYFSQDGTVIASQCCTTTAYTSGPTTTPFTSCGTSGTLGQLCDPYLVNGANVAGVVTGTNNCCMSGYALGSYAGDPDPWDSCSATCTETMTCYSMSSLSGGLWTTERGACCGGCIIPGTLSNGAACCGMGSLCSSGICTSGVCTPYIPPPSASSCGTMTMRKTCSGSTSIGFASWSDDCKALCETYETGCCYYDDVGGECYIGGSYGTDGMVGHFATVCAIA